MKAGLAGRAEAGTDISPVNERSQHWGWAEKGPESNDQQLPFDAPEKGDPMEGCKEQGDRVKAPG